MVPVFLKQPFLDTASSVWAMSKKEWIDDSPNSQDTKLIIEEAEQESNIDEVNFRKEVIDMWRRKEVELRVKELPGVTRVIFLGTDEQFNKTPWFLWARLFQGIGHSVKYVLFYAHPSKRFYPSSGPILAEHINGGYTNICSKDKIVIYRFEESTRVLLHELLHTACLDSEKDTVSLESHTEAWTELFLCSILSMGNVREFNRLWDLQCNWIYNQCRELSNTWNVNGPEDYVWRYIIGKAEVLKGLGFLECEDTEMEAGLRFTTPEWAI
jgi:hypothetical protein